MSHNHTIIFEKTDFMSTFRVGHQDSWMWHLKKRCHKKKFCAKVIFIPNDHFRGMDIEN